MKTKVYLGIAIRIILLFGVGMAATFITPELRAFFGDTLHVHTKECAAYVSGCSNSHEPDALYNWGARHYWYNIMMFFLFILSLINVVVSIIKLIKKNYDTNSW